jgi:TolB-like protein/tRNA A-37 threonylcarbamoyl transferase component Bud32
MRWLWLMDRGGHWRIRVHSPGKLLTRSGTSAVPPASTHVQHYWCDFCLGGRYIGPEVSRGVHVQHLDPLASDTADRASALAAALADHYRLERKLGSGGMATVYLARDRRHDRLVAVKVLHAQVDPDEGAERFAREIAIVARLVHPHIVPLFDSGVAAGQPWFVMPYIEGESLRDRLARGAPLSVAETVRIVHDVAEALDYAAVQGIVHRDVKPENILLGAHALVTDFGIARALSQATDAARTLTVAGAAIGTLDYAAPEQLFGEAVDTRADVYSLACTAWELLVGRPPFRAESVQQSIARRLVGAPPAFDPPRPDAAPLLAPLQSALRVEPSERQATCGALAAALLEATMAGIGAPSLSATVVATQSVTTLAVLPLVVRGEGDAEFLGEGIAEELLIALGSVPGLQVASRTASFAFRGPEPDLRAVAKRLHVDAAVCGTLRRVGDRIRVTVELLDLHTGHQRWAGRYDREFRHVFAMQEEIAQAIAQELKGRLLRSPPRLIGARHSADPQAYADYLRGRYFWNRRPRETPKGLACFERATERDPAYALAWAGLADCWATLGSWEAGAVEPADAFRRASEAARRAIALDPGLGEPFAALAYAEFHFAGDAAGARDNMNRAITLDPCYAHAHHWHSHLLLPLGHVDASLEASLRALRLEPLDTVINVHLAWHHHFAGNYAAAVEQAERTLALDADDFWAYFFMGLAHEQLSGPGGALRCFDEAARRANEHTVMRSATAHALATAGEHARARAILRDLEALAAQQYVSPYERGLVYLALGESDVALQRLHEARDRHDGWLPYAGLDPRLRAWIGNPDVAAALGRTVNGPGRSRD